MMVMKMDTVNQLNIDNLTSLWKKMGTETHSEFARDGLTVSKTWPYRFWFGWNATIEQITAFNVLLHRLPKTAIVPVWESMGERATQLAGLLTDECFHISFSQLAMYLDLHAAAMVDSPALDIVEVQSALELEDWTATASAAFGYWIDIAAIQRLLGDPDIHLLLVRNDGQPAATALVYQTGDIIGAHLVGVRDAYRGRGIARALMHYVINLSIGLGGKYLTLQASLAGEPLYRQLGFVPQFAIRNYHRI